MALKLKKQTAASVVAPPPDKVAFFLDENGAPQVKGADKIVRNTVTPQGASLTLNQTTTPANELDKAKLYAKDVTGVAELFVVDSSGADIQITDQGTLNAVVTSADWGFNWKGGTPGNPYVNGDTATAAFDEIVVIAIDSGQVVTVNMPAAAGNEGRVVATVNLYTGSAPGEVVFSPAVGESVGTGSAGTDQVSQSQFRTIRWMSDGISRWHTLASADPQYLS